MPEIAVTYETPTELPAAQALARELNLPLLSSDTHPDTDQFYLIQTPRYLALQNASLKKPFYIDFLTAQWQYRLRQASLRKEQLARAIGIPPKEEPKLIDATAGLGRDGFMLAYLGYELTLIERSPVLYALLRDGLHRAKQQPSLKKVVERLHLCYGEAVTLLPRLPADVIYLDPMFPEKNKAAAVKKEMVILQRLLGHDPDTDQLFACALTCARRRVVVKRPRLGKVLSTQPPDFTLMGTSSRFDVYIRCFRPR